MTIGRSKPTSLEYPLSEQQVADLDSMLQELYDEVVDTDIIMNDVTGNNVSSSKHGFAPKSPNDPTKFLNGAATPDYALVKDSDLSLSDITTNNVSITKHGLVPKAPNDATMFLNGVGAYAVVSSKPTLQNTTLTGAQNNFDLTASFTHLRVNSAAAVSFSGFKVAGAAPATGDRVIIDIINSAAEPVVFFREGAAGGSTAVHRMVIDFVEDVANLICNVGSRVELVYDGTASRWRVAAFDSGDRLTPVTKTTTGNIDDLAFHGGGLIRMNNATLSTIRGLVAGRHGQILSVVSIGAGPLQLANQDTNSAAANRIITLSQGTEQGLAFTLIYDAVSARWRQVTWGPHVARGRSTAQVAAVASVAALTVGAVDASFEVSANVLPTTSTTHNFTVTVAYTDEGNTARTLTLTFTKLDGTFVTAIVNGAGAVPHMGIPVHIRAKSATTITVATTGTFTTVTYNVEATVKQTAI